MELLSPASLNEAADHLRAAAADKVAIEILGASSKRGLGRPIEGARQVTTAGMSGILSYQPEELVLVARAGTHMGEIVQALAERNQHLAFEPPDFGALYAGDDAGGSHSGTPSGTLGGVLACNLSGPRRFKAGAARDHFLGFTALNGRGEIFKGGGPVVKNVTGYDLPKLLAGSFGTLALMDSVTVKVLPRPEKTRTALLYGLDAAAAGAVMVKALGGPYDISGAAYLPDFQAQESKADFVGGQGSVTAFRIEGAGPVVEHHCAALRRDFGPMFQAETQELHTAHSLTLWREIRDVAGFFEDDTILWRISIPPSHAAEVAGNFSIDLPGSNFIFDGGGGLIWLSLPADGGPYAEKVRGALKRCGGHATLVRASEAERSKVPVFEIEGSLELMRRVKESFDPDHLFNPGRMVDGI